MKKCSTVSGGKYWTYVCSEWMDKLPPGDAQLCPQQGLCPPPLPDCRLLGVLSCAQTDENGNNTPSSLSSTQLWLGFSWLLSHCKRNFEIFFFLPTSKELTVVTKQKAKHFETTAVPGRKILKSWGDCIISALIWDFFGTINIFGKLEKPFWQH